VLQCAAVGCVVLQRVAISCSVLQRVVNKFLTALDGAAGLQGVLQYVLARCVGVCCSVLHGVLQCASVGCCELQSVAACRQPVSYCP